MTVSVSDFPAGTPNRLSLRIGCYILFGVCTATLFVRFYVRAFISRKFGLDDLLITLSWMAEVVHIVCVKLQFENGTGWHVADLAMLPNGVAVINGMILWPWITQALYYFGLGCIKASIVALYLRLAVTPLQRNILWGMLIFVLAQGLSSTIVVAGFLCTPLSQVWTTPTAIGGPTCINILTFNYYNAALFIITDIFLALAPLAVIKNLQMDVKRKRALGIMFSLGVLAIGGTIARQVTNAIAINNTSDFTWHWAPTALCSILESSLGIVFVCVPAMAPLFKNWVGGGSSAKYTPNNYQSDRPSTFGKLRNKPKLRPDDESILCTTQITAVDRKDRDGAVESYEMDQQTGNYIGDGGSERRIITPPTYREQNGKKENECDGKSGVMVNVEYQVNRSHRKSGAK
ncbi:uncharacterized protein LY89DRAFT_731810 [Mollisia scopiformis]|uniref:Rhodopsin domain-containing protein n=1 Tax=Mollisia scopiformis TaxID=149040 RepID=A0A194XI18_MOLSC|nr:uncharacterized protein LY89DRAFT_731810 [Mollisia scopiformis]KUJ19412.1 hypothetical protein LY89DRAFT_731810 [Mollisia scopiformis]